MKFLPGATFDKPKSDVGGSGRLPADDINSLANDPRDLTATVAARGALIPILYGRRDIPGLVFVYGKLGTDLIIGYIWCIGEVDAIETIYLNDEVVPAGVTITNYVGTPTQGVDSTLATAVAAYNDTLRVDIPGGGKLGIAYSVVRIPVGKLGGFPRARAVIRGRKILDTRTSVVGYSANPALMVNDIITNPVFGVGKTAVGVDECADWDDTLLGGIPGAYRARAAIYIASGRPAEQYIDLLCEYAECLRVYEGATVRLVPDAPVDLDLAPVIGPADVLEGTFNLTAESSTDTPSEVELQYTQEPVIPSQQWALAPVIMRLPGVTEGLVQRIPTSITLDGVYRAVEAANKALARLNRMQNRLSVSWTTLDIGLIHQRGDVKKIQLPARGVDIAVRIESVQMAAYGRYNVSATRYDVSHYPSDAVLPGGDGFVPEGAIALLAGTTVPAGWALYTPPNGKYIVGAGGAYTIGDTGGSEAVAAWNFTSSADGAHTGTGLLGDAALGVQTPNRNFIASSKSEGNHTHTFGIPAHTVDMLRRHNQLIIKVGGGDLELPPAAMVLGLKNVNTLASKITTYAGRLLRADTVAADFGVGPRTFTVTTSSVADHRHAVYGLIYTQEFYSTIGDQYISDASSGGHRHTATITLTPKIKKQQLCLYGSAVTYAIRAGMIFMWSGSLISLPPDYVLCDGQNGTPDMRDRFLELAGNEPTSAEGNDTLEAKITLDRKEHNHYGGLVKSKGRGGTLHYDSEYHDHKSTETRPFTPPHYALAFIMLAPIGT